MDNQIVLRDASYDLDPNSETYKQWKFEDNLHALIDIFTGNIEHAYSQYQKDNNWMALAYSILQDYRNLFFGKSKQEHSPEQQRLVTEQKKSADGHFQAALKGALLKFHELHPDHAALLLNRLREFLIEEKDFKEFGSAPFTDDEKQKYNFFIRRIAAEIRTHQDRLKLQQLVDDKIGDIDLKNTLGHETIQHRAASPTDIHTHYKSKEIFLPGYDIPDSMIQYSNSLVGNPIEACSCFISHSSKDQEFADRLHNDLQVAGIRCWFAPRDLPIGAKTRSAIDEKIRTHDKFLLIISENSIESNWVEHEAEHALDLETERGKLMLFPVRLDNAIMASKAGWASNVKRQRNIGDFTKWKDSDAYKAAFIRLLRDLKT